MSYHGLREVKDNKYTDKTIQSGVYYWKAHIYRCEHCGRESRVLVKAEEPFFCDCNRLISVENANAICLSVDQQTEHPVRDLLKLNR